MKLELIYYSAAQSPALEARLTVLGDLTAITLTDSRKSLLRALSWAVERSDAVVVAGELSGNAGLLATVSNAVEIPLSLPAVGELLPQGSFPFVLEGKVQGCALESDGQAILLLSGDPEFLSRTLESYAVPWLRKKYPLSPVTYTPVSPDSFTPPKPISPARAALAELSEKNGGDQAALAPKQALWERRPGLNGDRMDDLFDDLFEELPPPPRRRVPLVIGVLVGLAVLAALVLFLVVYLPRAGTNQYDALRKTYREGGHEALLAKNPDYAGWLTVDGTTIDFPVTLSASRSEGFYQNHLFTGSRAFGGAAYVPADYSGASANMPVTASPALFSGLEQYLILDFYRRHPLVFFDIPASGSAVYKIIAVTLTDGDRPTGIDPLESFDPAQTSFSDTETVSFF
ncbi:MAG: hypothetical protein LBQ48_05625 [Oscillospiraceae bacterium]|nr:hypothetical protein [Oscillospiraceae bacterium]